jgi:cbb3-type cytochrome oxidase cytochrome c subunit
MKYGPLVFLAAFFAISISWFGFVLKPEVQLGRAMQETNSVVKADLYPAGRPGLARQGLEVYRANGCFYCHSQQVQQNGTLVDVVLTDAGKTPTDAAAALNNAHLGTTYSGPGLAAGLPKPVLRNVSIQAAGALASVLKKAGAATELHLVPTGPDIGRGWGARRSVAEDFIMDETVMPGSQRVGPDLANVGARRPDMNWQLVHLFNPSTVMEHSPMPANTFLFEKKKKQSGKQPSPDALLPVGGFTPPEGFEIVPKPEAKALAAYLLSLNAETPLYEAPLTPPAPAAATNAPAK